MAKRMAKPKGRRQYGSGSVYQRASDGRWVGVIEAGFTKTGARRRIVVTAASEVETKRKLKKKMAEVEAEGVPTSGTEERATVRTWGLKWLDLIVHNVRPKTYLNNRTAVTLWIIPTIGHKRLDALTPSDIRAVANAIRRAGKSTSTALRAHSVLTQMLKDAIVEGHRVPQRVLLVEKPTKAVNDRDAIPLVDAIRMLQVDTPDRSRWAAAFLQGMRQGECLGLTWECVNFDADVLDVSWQLQALNYVHGCAGEPCGRKTAKACPMKRLRVPDGYEYRQLDGTLCLVRPKTEKGQRLIPLVPYMKAALERWRDIAPNSPHGLVWPQPDGRPRIAKDDTEDWKRLQQTAEVAGPNGRPYALHEARHTTATLLLEAGVDPEVIKAIMGHASILTTRIYQHVSQTMTRKALEGLATRLELTA